MSAIDEAEKYGQEDERRGEGHPGAHGEEKTEADDSLVTSDHRSRSHQALLSTVLMAWMRTPSSKGLRRYWDLGTC